jgi:hypothetical protein
MAARSVGAIPAYASRSAALTSGDAVLTLLLMDLSSADFLLADLLSADLDFLFAGSTLSAASGLGLPLLRAILGLASSGFLSAASAGCF